MDYTKKNICVSGAGESGVGAALLAQKLGAKVFVSDAGKIHNDYKSILQENNIEFEEGQHNTDKLLTSHLIIKSPGISNESPVIQTIKQANIELLGEIEFACQHTDAKLICITGSNGKTTTTHLIHHTLKTAGFDCGIAGNMGKSFSKALLTEKHGYYVLEISSFMLDDIESFKPHIAIILNITENHLNRYHDSLEEYARSKFRITKNLGANDFLIYNQDDEMIVSLLPEYQRDFNLLSFSQKEKTNANIFSNYKTKEMIVSVENDPFTLTLESLALKGKHNEYNYMAAAAVASIHKINKATIQECFQTFKGLKHRLETVAKVRGVRYVNDSKSTSVNATWYALESFEKTELVLILGGIDKGNDYSSLIPLVKEKVKGIVCLGKDNKKILDAFSEIAPKIQTADNMKEALSISTEWTNPGDTVLLSPACASFDLFENYEQRGEIFREEVMAL